jgi:hypothetical protein
MQRLEVLLRFLVFGFIVERDHYPCITQRQQYEFDVFLPFGFGLNQDLVDMARCTPMLVFSQ